MPQRTRAERRVRAAPFRAVEHTHGFTLGAAQSFVSALRQSRVRDTNSTALSQTCLRGNRKKNPFSQCVHHCERGMNEHRDLLSAYRGLHVHRNTDGFDRLDLKAVNVGWLNRQDIDRCRGSVASSPNRRGRRTSANAEVGGAHQSAAQSQGREATEPVGTNFHHQPAYGDAHMSNETAVWHGESPHFQCREDAKNSR